jgi:hypothetical protein
MLILEVVHGAKVASSKPMLKTLFRVLKEPDRHHEDNACRDSVGIADKAQIRMPEGNDDRKIWEIITIKTLLGPLAQDMFQTSLFGSRFSN